jgi:hypothetical protein
MIRRVAYLVLLTGVMAVLGQAQTNTKSPIENQLYCSGLVSSEPVAQDTYVISGPESYFNVIYSDRQQVFLNKGASQGVKVGDEFQVIRPVEELLHNEWFVSQSVLMKAMGTTYEDEGRLRVVSVQQNTSTAEVVFSCNYVQRGDIAQPFTPRPAPTLKSETKVDPFAPSSGKAKAMIVSTRFFGELASEGKIVYVNLGTAQGVKVGDYFRIFRYQGEQIEKAYQTPHTEYALFGFGAAPRPYLGTELPRDILGEGVVLRLGKNAATVLITSSDLQIYPGDYVELE